MFGRDSSQLDCRHVRPHNACRGDDEVCVCGFYVAVICNLYVRLACFEMQDEERVGKGRVSSTCECVRLCAFVCVV